VIGRSEIRKLRDRLVFSRGSLFWLLDLLQGELSRPAKAYRLTYSHGACKAWAWVRFVLGGSLLPLHTETFFIRGRGNNLPLTRIYPYPLVFFLITQSCCYIPSPGGILFYIYVFWNPSLLYYYWSTFSLRWPFCLYERVFFVWWFLTRSRGILYMTI